MPLKNSNPTAVRHVQKNYRAVMIACSPQRLKLYAARCVACKSQALITLCRSLQLALSKLLAKHLALLHGKVIPDIQCGE
jgi:hypothetical protein